MKSKFTREGMFWAGGTIALSIVSSALWEGIKPALVWLGFGLLDVVTLGLGSLRDGMYDDVARGVTQQAALSALGAIVGASVGLLLVVALRRGRTKVEPPVRSRFVKWFGSRGTALALAIFMGLMFVRTDYVIRASAHVERLQTIAGAHMSEDQRLGFRSRAAQIARRADYVLLTNELAAIARQGGATVPTFNIY